MKQNRKLAKFIRGNLPLIVQAIKAVHTDQTDGYAKLDRASLWLANRVDIPLIPEWLERELFKVAICTIVELARSIYGDDAWFGHLTELFGGDNGASG